MLIPVGSVYSKVAIDYSAGLDIFDSVDNKFYTQEQAVLLPKSIKTRLTMKPRKIGCWVVKEWKYAEE